MTKLLEFILAQGEQFRRARLPSLYSDFSLQRYTNPDGYAANIVAWEVALTKAVGEGLIPAGPDGPDLLCLRTGDDLLQSLETREWGRPLALGTVIDEAVSQQHLIPVNEFLSLTSSIYRQGWFTRPWWLYFWGLRHLDRASAPKNLRNERYVIVKKLEKAAGQILSHFSNRNSHVDRIYSLDMFRKEVAHAMNVAAEIRTSDFSVILRHLARDKGMIVYDDHVVKLTLFQGGTCRISSEDYAIASLKSLISDINRQADLLTSEINTLAIEAQNSIKNQNRPLALRRLRSKKLVESTLVQRLEALSTLEGIYGKIEQASDQIAFVQAIKSSTGVLRNLNAQVGKMEKVEDMVEELRQEMNTVEDIGRIMEGAGHDTTIDDDAINKELEALTQDFKSEEEKQRVEMVQKRLASINDTSTGVLDRGLQSQNVSKTGNISPIRLGDPENSLVLESTRALGRMSMDDTKNAKDAPVEQGQIPNRAPQVIPNTVSD